MYRRMTGAICLSPVKTGSGEHVPAGHGNQKKLDTERLDSDIFGEIRGTVLEWFAWYQRE